MISHDPQYYVQGVLEQDRRMLAKAITLIESTLPAHRNLARDIIDRILPFTGKAMRIGITGIPGIGKSTFIETLGMKLVKKGHHVAVLAVDPSSSRSGGSIMADKTRMEKLSVEERAFIRPSPSGETLGGVAGKTRETMLLCEAAGFDVIIVETVGAGQSETTVASMVDFFLVLMLAGAGDELQAIKKGVLELADAIAINRTDGDNVEKAKKAKKVYETVLHLIHPASLSWVPPVVTCSALEMTGIDDIWEIISDHRKKLTVSGELETKRKKQALAWLWFLLEEGLKERFYQNPNVKRLLPKIKKEVEKGTTSPAIAANKLFSSLDEAQGDQC